MKGDIEPAALAHELERSTGQLLEAARQVMTAAGGAMYATDLFVLAAVKRALSLSTSIFELLDNEQALAAVTLARPHLDTLLRLHSLWLVRDPTAHVNAIMSGERLDRQKDRQGRALSDRRLMTALAAEPGLQWVATVYERASGFVHMSESTIYQIFSGGDPTTRTFTAAISPNYKASLADEIDAKMFAVEVNDQVALRVTQWAEQKNRLPR